MRSHYEKSSWSGAERHLLPRLEAELDGAMFPIRALLSGYSVHAVAPDGRLPDSSNRSS